MRNEYYGIFKDGLLFAGFGPENQILMTKDPEKAWGTECKTTAEIQASLLNFPPPGLL